MTDAIAALVERHRLAPHPEGGYYRETYRSPLTVAHPVTGAHRAASTAILFLLTPASFSAFHRLRSDEVWHYYGGDPVRLHILTPEGVHRQIDVGADGELQAFVQAGWWQAACCSGESYSLCGCTVAPGFDFEDFEMGSRTDLVSTYRAHRELIEAFTRSER